jgi:hypothetical protein
LKLKQQLFENSFNIEIVEVNVDEFFAVLESVLALNSLPPSKKNTKTTNKNLI